MRKLRGEHVVPTIELSSTTMRTRFGTKTAPHFLILRDQWVNFGPVASAIAGPVAPPTPAEIVDDSIPDPSGLVVGGVKVAWSAISDHPCPENMPWNDSIPDNL